MIDYDLEIHQPAVRYWDLVDILSKEGFEGDTTLHYKPDRELGPGWYKPEEGEVVLRNGKSGIELKIDMFRKELKDEMFLNNTAYVSSISFMGCDEDLVELIELYVKES